MPLIKKVYDISREFGFDLRRMVYAVPGMAKYIADLSRYKASLNDSADRGKKITLRPCLSDAFCDAGAARGHYFHGDLWAAHKVFASRPETHWDIGSRIDGLVAHVSVFCQVNIIDIRPLTSSTRNVVFIQDDATELQSVPDLSVRSLSSVHAAEHFGLGRYGDPINPDGWLDFFKAVQRKLAPGGIFYLGLPVGQERVEFNAHRVFSAETIPAYLPELELKSFSYVSDDGDLFEDRIFADCANARYACGLYEFEKTS